METMSSGDNGTGTASARGIILDGMPPEELAILVRNVLGLPRTYTPPPPLVLYASNVTTGTTSGHGLGSVALLAMAMLLDHRPETSDADLHNGGVRAQKVLGVAAPHHTAGLVEEARRWMQSYWMAHQTTKTKDELKAIAQKKYEWAVRHLQEIGVESNPTYDEIRKEAAKAFGRPFDNKILQRAFLEVGRNPMQTRLQRMGDTTQGKPETKPKDYKTPPPATCPKGDRRLLEAIAACPEKSDKDIAADANASVVDVARVREIFIAMCMTMHARLPRKDAALVNRSKEGFIRRQLAANPTEVPERIREAAVPLFGRRLGSSILHRVRKAVEEETARGDSIMQTQDDAAAPEPPAAPETHPDPFGDLLEALREAHGSQESRIREMEARLESVEQENAALKRENEELRRTNAEAVLQAMSGGNYRVRIEYERRD